MSHLTLHMPELHVCMHACLYVGGFCKQEDHMNFAYHEIISLWNFFLMAFPSFTQVLPSMKNRESNLIGAFAKVFC